MSPVVQPIKRAVLALGSVAILSMVAVVVSDVLHREPPLPTDRLSHWLTCFDCTLADLDAVLAQARREPDSTRRFFASALLDGPGAGELRETVGAIRRGYALDAAYLRTHDTTIHLPPEDEYVSEDSVRFDRSWRSRAAIALGQIGTPAALGILRRAMQALNDSSVLEAIAIAPDTGRVRAALRRARGP